MEGVKKEIEYSSDDKKEEYKIAQIEKINDKLRDFLNNKDNNFDENFKSYVESKTIENQQDQVQQKINLDNGDLTESANILIEKYNSAKILIDEKSSKPPNNEFQPVNRQDNQRQRQ